MSFVLLWPFPGGVDEYPRNARRDVTYSKIALHVTNRRWRHVYAGRKRHSQLSNSHSLVLTTTSTFKKLKLKVSVIHHGLFTCAASDCAEAAGLCVHRSYRLEDLRSSMLVGSVFV